MIEDIEGATTEPTRHRHVVLLSAATAAVALVLLVALVVPPPRVATPQEQPRLPSAIIVGPATTYVTVEQLRRFVSRASECGESGLNIPPGYVWVEAPNGLTVAVGPSQSTPRSAPLPVLAQPRTGWLIVSCVTPNNSVPSEAISR
ncbi:MAG TPA: hypothetical protein VGR85_01625 [Candidatus Limnocylindria bacterium]|nr:hypothetical protein [Candidatus Limnocylindria bacterium]